MFDNVRMILLLMPRWYRLASMCVLGCALLIILSVFRVKSVLLVRTVVRYVKDSTISMSLLLMTRGLVVGLSFALLNTSSFVFLAFNSRSLSAHHCSRWCASCCSVDGSLRDRYSMSTVSSAYLMMFIWSLASGVWATYSENRNGLWTHPWGLPVDLLIVLDVFFDVVSRMTSW